MTQFQNLITISGIFLFIFTWGLVVAVFLARHRIRAMIKRWLDGTGK